MASVLRSTVRWTLSSLSARGVARWRPLSSETTGSVVKTGTSEEVVEYVSPDELVSIHYTQTVHTKAVDIEPNYCVVGNIRGLKFSLVWGHWLSFSFIFKGSNYNKDYYFH